LSLGFVWSLYDVGVGICASFRPSASCVRKETRLTGWAPQAASASAHAPSSGADPKHRRMCHLRVPIAYSAHHDGGVEIK